MSGELNGGMIQFQVVLRPSIIITSPAAAGENTRIQTEILLTWNENDRCQRAELIWDYWKVKTILVLKFLFLCFVKFQVW